MITFDFNMDPAKIASASLAHSSGIDDNDETELLAGNRVPLMKIRPIAEHQTEPVIGHSIGNSRELMTISEDSTSLPSFNENLGPIPRSTPRRGNLAPSRSSSLLSRLTSIRSPISPILRTATRRGGSAQYDELGDYDVDSGMVDLSSLAGMGFEMREPPQEQIPAIQEEPFQDVETEYVSHKDAEAKSDKPRFKSFSGNAARIGGGMVLGAELKYNPSMARLNRANSMAKNPEEESMIERSKTVRKIGHNLAQEKHAIVAVAESFDISSFEGHRVSHRLSNQSFESMSLPSRNMTATMSYFFPDDPDIPNWRPFSMSMPYILLLTLMALGLAGFQEWLCRRSQSLNNEHTAILAFDNVIHVPLLDFFAWKYLPTIITIFYAVLFSIMDFDIRRLEPYYQLSRPLGCRASASLNLDHLTVFQYFVPLNALKLKQWAVFFSTIGNIIASTVAPSLQNPSIQFVVNPDCQLSPRGPEVAHCTNVPAQNLYFVQIQPGWSRALTTSYAVTAAILVVLLVLLRRKTGLQRDPMGIAGIASMATKSHILNDFRGTDLFTRGEIHKELQHRNYILYKSSIWQGQWSQNGDRDIKPGKRLKSPHPIFLQLSYGIPFIATLFAALAAIPIISFTTARIVPNDVPWLPIMLATILKMLWSSFESDVRLIEPFYRLSKGGAKPEESITLDYQGTVYGWMPIRAFFNKHYILCLVGVCSVALDILTVTISSFSVNSQIFLHHQGDQERSSQDETSVSFFTSVVLSMLIVSFTIFTASLVYGYRRHPFLPREPSTIAAVLAFIYASKMLDDFVGTEHMSNKAMEEKLKGLNKTYSLGWFRGRDGKSHCAIDQDPLVSKYVHGLNYEAAVAPWSQDDTFV